MCGLSGYWSPQRLPEQVIVDMNSTLRHRGPDAEGYYHDGPVALGHRRLAVVDLEASRQPMSTPDGGITIVFNGEIYNFPALRQELSAQGYAFRTQGDTEVLLYAYRAWGTDMLTRLQGMFAFALWDKPAQRLFMARDHMGVKPFYYAWDEKSLVFASELKAVTRFPGLSTDIDLDALGTYLECQYIPAPDTIYRSVKKLPPAHAMLLEGGRLRTWKYWEPDYSRKESFDEESAIAALDAELRQSIRGMLMADVPLGCFLSGGIDSSLVAALTTDVAGRPVDTFNLGFEGQVGGSEHQQAAQVAQHIGARHHPLMIGLDSVLDSLSDWVDIFDEPFGDQAALPTMLLSKLTRQNVTVVLTGEGADEIFCGYSNYGKRVREERISRFLGHRHSPLHHLVRLMPTTLRKDRLLQAIGEPLERRYSTIPNVFNRALQPGLFSRPFLAAQRSCIADFAASAYQSCNSAHYIEKLMHVDGRLWLPDDLLTKVDRATMAYSLEARVPYLDHKFVEFCARLDPGYKLHGKTRKYLLKRLAEKYLPREIVHRPKQGFVMPLSEWLAGSLRHATQAALSGNGLGRRGLFRPAALEKLTRQHYSGQKNHAGRLWALFVLEKWFERYAPDFRL